MKTRETHNKTSSSSRWTVTKTRELGRQDLRATSSLWDPQVTSDRARLVINWAKGSMKSSHWTALPGKTSVTARATLDLIFHRIRMPIASKSSCRETWSWRTGLEMPKIDWLDFHQIFGLPLLHFHPRMQSTPQCHHQQCPKKNSANSRPRTWQTTTSVASSHQPRPLRTRRRHPEQALPAPECNRCHPRRARSSSTEVVDQPGPSCRVSGGPGMAARRRASRRRNSWHRSLRRRSMSIVLWRVELLLVSKRQRKGRMNSKGRKRLFRILIRNYCRLSHLR